MTSKAETVVGEKSPLHFARLEFKYLLSAKKRLAVERDLQYFLQYDPFVIDRDDHRYIVQIAGNSYRLKGKKAAGINPIIIPIK